MASSRVFLLAALCSLVILSAFIDSTQSASCCMRYIKRRIKCHHLLGYTIQNIHTTCDINAVIFHLPGRFVCANPSSSWTQTGMRCIDERERRVSQILANRTLGNTTSSA